VIIELRSDTFTLPTEEMLQAIARARLGNDGYGEDPTVIELEELAAVKLEKEAACLMPSGTMANLASMLAYCHKGMIIVGDRSDMYVYEADGDSICPAVSYLPVGTNDDGTLRNSDVEQAFQAHAPRIAAICLENPHNLCGGVVLSEDYLRDVASVAHSRGASLHLDGARIFNAAVASGTTVAKLVRFSDSIQLCLSKGLSAPVGSLVIGSTEFVRRVRELRKILGGTMRQAGIIAAPGIVALKTMGDRLKEDHLNARRFAEGLAALPGIQVNLDTVQTNTVVFRVLGERFTPESFMNAAWQHGVHLCDFKYGRLRAVFHRNITRMQVEHALNVLAHLLTESTDVAAPTALSNHRGKS
jgi:threonine aldolase